MAAAGTSGGPSARPGRVGKVHEMALAAPHGEGGAQAADLVVGAMETRVTSPPGSIDELEPISTPYRVGLVGDELAVPLPGSWSRIQLPGLRRSGSTSRTQTTTFMGFDCRPWARRADKSLLAFTLRRGGLGIRFNVPLLRSAAQPRPLSAPTGGLGIRFA